MLIGISTFLHARGEHKLLVVKFWKVNPMALLERGMFALLQALSESAPFVILGLLIAGLIREFVPAAALKERLGGHGLRPVLRAVGLGSLLPICSCSTIPLGLGMARSGAGTGTALSFMTSAPAVSPVTVALGLTLLGPALLSSYIAVVLIGSIAIGLLGNLVFTKRHDVAPPEEGCGCGCDHHPTTVGGRILAAARWSLFEFGSEVSLSLLVGLILSAAILVFTPSDVVTSLVGEPSLLSFVTVILLSLPAYTCSVPALLIVGSLLAKGADPGLAVAFLVAGPATNLGELNSIRAGLGSRVAGFYFIVVASLAIAAGLVIGQLPLPKLDGAVAAAADSHHGHAHLHIGVSDDETGVDRSESFSVAMWRWPFVALVSGLAIYSAAVGVGDRIRKRRIAAKQEQPPTLVALDVQAIEGGSR